MRILICSSFFAAGVVGWAIAAHYYFQEKYCQDVVINDTRPTQGYVDDHTWFHRPGNRVTLMINGQEYKCLYLVVQK